MKLSNIFIVLSLIAGGMSPMALVLGQKKDVKVTKADGTKDLAEIMSTPTCSFSYTSIDNFFFNVPLSEQIFTNTGYFNDHLTDGTYKNAQGQNINIGEGIEINGHTLQYWIDFNPATLSFPRNDGVCVFPLYAGKVFNPVAIEVKANSMNFKVNLEYIPMDSIVLTFKAGVFEGYYNGVTFVLNEDLTFYSSAATSGGPHRVAFAKQDNTTRIKAGSTHIDDKGERTAPNGGKYHRWLMWTNIPFDSDHITQACPADNYRYMYDNLLMNGKPITYYNAWVRGNSKDFTNLSDTSTQNPDYELSHPTGSANTVYDLGIRIEVVTDQPVYAFQFSVPNQLVTDLSLGTLTFGLRDGSDWFAKIGGVTKILRYSESAHAADQSAIQSFVNSALHMNDYTESLGYCNDNEHHYYLTAKAAYNALTDEQKVSFQKDDAWLEAKARYTTWATHNNDADPFDGNNSVVTTINSAFLSPITQKTGNVVLVALVVASIASLSVLAVVLVLKKKRQY